jgi:hypothetical protein
VVLPLAFPDKPDLEEGDPGLDLTLRSLRRYAEAAAGPGRLHAAGVRVAFTTRGLKGLTDVLPNLRKIVEAGLPEDAALAALTVEPARLLHADKLLGTVEPGKIANLLVCDGPLMAEKTRIVRTYVDGVEYRIPEKPGPKGDPTAVVDPRGTWSVTLDLGEGARRAPGSSPGRRGRTRGRRKPRPERAPSTGSRWRGTCSPCASRRRAARWRPRSSSRGTPGRDGGGGHPVGARARHPYGAAGGGAVRTLLLLLLLAALPADPRRPQPFHPEVVVVQHATVWTQGPQGVLEDADLLLRGGKVAAVGRGLAVPSGAFVVDGRGKHVTPGLVDCHSHTAIRGGVNEGSDTITAEVRVAT